LTWLQEHGAKHGNLEFRGDSRGGVGAFAARSLKSGDAIASLPSAAAFTLDAAKKEPLGVAASAALSTVRPSSAGSPGCLLPLFDLLNHRSSQAITWEASNDCIVFTAQQDIAVGDEVFNNYGSRGNEQLLFYYGFAEAENSDRRDTLTGLVLCCDFDPGSEDARRTLRAKHQQLLAKSIPCGIIGSEQSSLRLGPFTLGPLVPDASSGPSSVLPEVLLDSLGIVCAASEDEAPDGRSAEALCLLHPSLVASLADLHRAAPAPDTPEDRQVSIKAYLDGRRRILEAALREVETLLASMASSDDEECNDIGK